MKYNEFSFEIGKHFASLQKFLNELNCPDGIDSELFNRSKSSAIEACIGFEQDLLDEFGEHFDD